MSLYLAQYFNIYLVQNIFT